jgi:hypothetical protein
VNWRIGLIDSCGAFPTASVAARFVASAQRVVRVDCGPDPTGHGTRIASIISADGAAVELVLAQVFTGSAPTSAAIIAAALDWAVGEHVNLLHLSLGLAADRPILRSAIAQAVARGILLVAAMPARGGPVFPAAYPGVIRGTGDARCQPGELSALEPGAFGGCPRHGGGDGQRGQGASIGAAAVTRALIHGGGPDTYACVIRRLTALARYLGPESRRAALSA